MKATPRLEPLLVLVVFSCLLLSVPATAGAAEGIDAALLAGIEARSIGPATMSGRVAAVEAVPGDPDTLYVGSASGGVWKSTDGALTWEPIFDDEPVASIGAVAVHPERPEIVWVGTGEGNPRNSTSVGNGVYRSLDGGETWEHLGLEETERIHRVLLHPGDPDVAYVAALGKTWGENPERGVFKTTDGGTTWEKVLFVDESTGAADLVMDPTNPDKLVAAMWDHRRWPWFFRSGGPGSGLHLTRDGGRTWTRLTPEDGLPEGELGRIGLAWAPSDASRLYAIVEAEDGIRLHRSDDGGASWTKTPAEEMVGNRPFYYADLRVDPRDPDRVYSLWSRVSVSNDGGESFEMLVPFREVHPDHHAMWINPADPTHIYEGNDGGVYVSRDRGHTWRFVSNLPLAQLYHLRVDDEHPYNVYFGLQDNGSWKGPAEVWENASIRNYHWREVAFGDGFDTAPLPNDSTRGYAMSQEGFLVRWDLETGERKGIRPGSPATVPAGGGGVEEVPLRFNWSAALAVDPFDPETVWFGSQFVHRSRDLGDTWEIVSPDLTTDNPEWQNQEESGGLTLDVSGAENFTSLVSLAPSVVERGVLWAGSDDGRIHVTRDGAATWTSVEGNLPRGGGGVPEHTWVAHIHPSNHAAGTAFAVFDNHRRSDWGTYAYRTDDFGATWRRLPTGGVRGYALSILQDPVDPDLLWLGTEFGLWVSMDGGESWAQWTHGFPTASAKDLAFQARENDLVVGTHGRGVYVLDDVTPLRGLEASILEETVHLFDPPPAQEYRVAQTGSSRFPGHGEFRGENEPYGALLTFSLSDPELPHPDEEVERERRQAERATRRAEEEERLDRPSRSREEGERSAVRESGGTDLGEAGRRGPSEEELEEGEEAEDGEDEDAPGKPDRPKATIVVTDEAGAPVRTFEVEVHRGVNRAVWDLTRDAYRQAPRDQPSFFEPSGPPALPGTYTVTVRYGGEASSAPLEVVGDPRFDLPMDERRAKVAALGRAGELQEALVEAIERVHDARTDARAIEARAKAEDAEALRRRRVAGEALGPDAEGPHAGLAKAAGKLVKDLAELERKLWVPPDVEAIVPDTDALSHVQRSAFMMSGSFDAPTEAQLVYLGEAEARTREALEAVNAFFADEVAAFRELYRESDLGVLPEEEPIEMPE